MSRTLLCGFLVNCLLAGCASVELPPVSTFAAPKTPLTQSSQEPLVVEQAPAARVPATGTAEDARRHTIRGMAAIEMAKSPTELIPAEDEFRMATEIDPQLANAWFNLGKVQSQLGKYREAMDSYRQYLAHAPGAPDAQNVQSEIIKLEFRQELENKVQARVGTWVGSWGTFYRLTLDGNRMTLKTDSRHVPEDEVSATYTLVGNVPTQAVTAAEFQLVLQGNRLAGSWMRGPVQADKCSVPADSAKVVGELSDRDKKMVLHYETSSFQAATQMSILTDDYCGGVTSKGRKAVDEVLFGPLGLGAPGFGMIGLNGWWDGGFSMVRDGWQGRLAANVTPETSAYAVGLRDGDEILAIDGVPVKSLSAGEAVMRLYGQPGSALTLEVWRKEIKDPFVVRLSRSQWAPK